VDALRLTTLKDLDTILEAAIADYLPESGR